MQSLYRSHFSLSMSFFIATNSAPKTEVSIVACHLEIQLIRAILRNIKMPVREHLVSLLPTWSLSHIILIIISLPRGGGILSGMASRVLSIEFRPVMFWESEFINYGIGRVKD